MTNNEVRKNGKVAGFRCYQCGKIYQQMWANTCNGCRRKNEQHDELISEIKSLKEQLKNSIKVDKE